MKRSQMLDMLYNEIVGYDPTGSPKVLAERLLELMEANGMLPPATEVVKTREVDINGDIYDLTWNFGENAWSPE